MSVVPEVRAAGLIVFRRVSTGIEYLLLQAARKEGDWSPPKGHVDPGESDMEAAIRETQEETGLHLKDLSIIKSFEKVLKYAAFDKPKSVVYWAAELTNTTTAVAISEEHKMFCWSPLSKACTLAAYTNMVSALQECEEFLKKYYEKL